MSTQHTNKMVSLVCYRIYSEDGERSDIRCSLLDSTGVDNQHSVGLFTTTCLGKGMPKNIPVNRAPAKTKWAVPTLKHFYYQWKPQCTIKPYGNDRPYGVTNTECEKIALRNNKLMHNKLRHITGW